MTFLVLGDDIPVRVLNKYLASVVQYTETLRKILHLKEAFFSIFRDCLKDYIEVEALVVGYNNDATV